MEPTAPERHPHPTYEGVYVYKQRESRYWHMETCVDGRKIRKSLKTDRLAAAFALAGDEWKLFQRTKQAEDKKRKKVHIDRLASEPTIGELFLSWRATLQPNKRPYHDTKWGAVGRFWRTKLVSEITPQLFRDYYQLRRRETTQYDAPPSNSTLKKDAILLRLILKHAVEEGHIEHMPLIPNPGKIDENPRPWLTQQEWRNLQAKAEERIAEAVKEKWKRVARQRQDTLDFARFMVASMCRVEELENLRFSDCRVEKSAVNPKQNILLMQVTGKRGTRDAVASHNAAQVYLSRLKRRKPDSLIFDGIKHRDTFRELLIAAKLRTNPQGFQRNAKSLRATSISFAVLRGGKNPNLLMIARNAGTSLQMIDKFYAKRLSAEMWKDELGVGDATEFMWGGGKKKTA